GRIERREGRRALGRRLGGGRKRLGGGGKRPAGRGERPRGRRGLGRRGAELGRGRRRGEGAGGPLGGRRCAPLVRHRRKRRERARRGRLLTERAERVLDLPLARERDLGDGLGG